MSKQTTRVKTFKANLEWKIENFAEKRCLFEKNRPLRSSKFGTAGVDFEVSIYDTGLSNSKQSVIGIHHCSCSYSVVRAICNIFVLGCGNPDNGANRLSVVHAKVDISREIRELDPIDLNKINSSPYFTVYVEVEFCPQGCAEPECEPIFFCIPEDSKCVARSNLHMLDSANFTDCLFKIGEDEIKAHRCFLAQHSEVFRTMFSQESMIEAEKGIVEIKDSDYPSVRAMLEFIYCGSTSSIEKNVEGVLALAEKYAIKPLKEFCGNYLASRINTTTIAKIAAIGELYCSTPLIKRCARYLAENRISVLRSKEWEELKKQNPELAIRLLELSF
uniref:BTB and MATH domain-containing protein 42 n=1 Tax=Ascaris suum TaxID=6253 RepID=F1L6F9_ASCSU